MQITMTPAALAFVNAQGASGVTVASLVFSSCCSGPLPPEVKPGAPADREGFSIHDSAGGPVYYDSLLDLRAELVIDLKDYGSYQELFVQGWE
jgi:hypothetical protein